MDDAVTAAMARWPDVPHVFGWMSLSEQGLWRLHPNADAWQPGKPCSPPFSAGESIDSPQVRQFIGRNYACDARGQWYFQNGPQRVYVRLDAAPFILHTDTAAPTLRTHNGLPVKKIEGWWLDDEGKLYALTEHGAGLVSGRDTLAVFEALSTSEGQVLGEILEQSGATAFNNAAERHVRDQSSHSPIYLQFQTSAEPGLSDTVKVPLYRCSATDIEIELGFTRCPQP